jgi:hypothetical protein
MSSKYAIALQHVWQVGREGDRSQHGVILLVRYQFIGCLVELLETGWPFFEAYDGFPPSL